MKNVADIFPLSPMQELMLVHSLAAPRSEVLINQLVYALPGPLDVSALEQAWQAVVKRHAMLRVGFAWENLKQPMQFVREDVILTLERLDWQAEPRATLEDKLAPWLQADRERALTLTKPPLMRLTLIGMAEAEHWLVWTSHHLILDRWCIGLILQEVSALYEERCGGQPAALPQPHSYRDFVAWLQKRDRSATETFWREQLRGLRHPTALPILPPGGAVGEFAELHTRVAAPTVEALRDVAQRNRLTMGTLAVGAWALLLGALSRQPEVLLGVTVFGRPAELPGVENIIGSFINTLPSRLPLPPDEALLTWLASVQQRQLALRDYEHVSLPQLQEWSEFEHNVALFETLFLFQAPVKTPASTSRLQWRSLRGTFRTGLPLALAVAEEADGLTLWATYAQSRFTDEMVRAWLERFEIILQAMAADPQHPLSAFLAGVEPVTVAQSSSASHTASFSRNGHTPVAPRNAIETQLARLWGPILDLPTVDVTANFFESGGTSLKALQLMDRVERTFKSKLPLASLLQAPTIEKLAALIDRGSATEKWSSLIPIQPLGAQRPLFVVHHGGGGIFEFANVARYLGNDQPVYGLQEPGFEAGEARLGSVEALAGHYVRELRSIQPEGPYALSGFCFGGVVAYEMAQQLRKQGQRADVLFLIDATSPNATLGGAARASRRRRLMRDIARLSLSEKLLYLGRRLLKRLRWEAERRVIGAQHLYRVTTYRVYQKLKRPEPAFLRQYALMQHNGQLVEHYRAQPYDDLTVLIRSRQPDMVADYGWDAVVANGVRVRQMPTADHLEMMIEPNVELLAGHLQHYLVRREAARNGARV